MDRDGADRQEADERRRAGRSSEAGATPAERSEAQPVVGGGKAVLTALGVLAWIGVLQVAYLTFVELNGLLVRSQELEARREVVATLEREADLLRSIVENGGDPAYREALARKQGFMYPTETRIVVLSPR